MTDLFEFVCLSLLRIFTLCRIYVLDRSGLQELCITGNYREPHVFEHITIDRSEFTIFICRISIKSHPHFLCSRCIISPATKFVLPDAELQVLNGTCQLPYGSLMRCFHRFHQSLFCSLTALTRIILQDCAFAPPLQCLPQLRRVYLFNVMSRRNWLGPAFAPLSGLTFLGFDCCICLDSRSDEDLMPISSLRSACSSLTCSHLESLSVSLNARLLS